MTSQQRSKPPVPTPPGTGAVAALDAPSSPQTGAAARPRVPSSPPRTTGTRGRSPGTLSVRAGRTALTARMSEDDLEAAMRRVIRDLRKHGGQILAYHPWRQHARRAAPGWPDWFFAGRGGVMARELKRESGNPTAEQQEWLYFLDLGGLDVGVWRPSDWLSGRMTRELTVIAGLGGAR